MRLWLIGSGIPACFSSLIGYLQFVQCPKSVGPVNWSLGVLLLDAFSPHQL